MHEPMGLAGSTAKGMTMSIPILNLGSLAERFQIPDEENHIAFCDQVSGRRLVEPHKSIISAEERRPHFESVMAIRTHGLIL
jgi:hypothetical protein